MIVSHINYGQWNIDETALRQAAQTGSYLRECTDINLFPVTVISVKTQHQQIDEQLRIRHSDRLEHDGGEILSQIPAISGIRKSGHYGFDPVFRGFKYDQLNVVLNGAQCATAACPNRMDPPTSQMAPNMMQKIEILKGPHALRYGTGIGATINFVPAALRFSNESKRVYGRMSGGYEQNGQVFRGETQLGLSSSHYDFSVFGSWSQGDDYSTGNGGVIPADFTRGSIGAQMGLLIDNRQELRISATHNQAKDTEFPALPMDLRTDETWLLNARHEMQVHGEQLKNWNTTLFGSFVNHTMDNLLRSLNPRMMNAITHAKTQHYGGRTESIWLLGESKMFLGADLRFERAEGIRTREFLMGPRAGSTVFDNAWQEGRIRRSALFAEWQGRNKGFDYVLSGRLAWFHAQVQNPAEEFTQVYPKASVNQINPSISIGMRKAFGTTLEASIWLARAQRSGGLTERFINYFPVGQDPYELLGNPTLSPEVNYQLDASLQAQYAEDAFQLDVFVSYLDDYISSIIREDLDPRLPMSPGIRQFVNIDKAFKSGFELSWTHAWSDHWQQQLSAAYTYGQDLEREQPLPEIAPLDVRYALSGSFGKDRWKPSLSIRYVQNQLRISEEFGEQATPSFVLMDCKLGFVPIPAISVYIGVNNVWDENYYEHLSRSVRGTQTPLYAPGRNLFANFNYSF